MKTIRDMKIALAILVSLLLFIPGWFGAGYLQAMSPVWESQRGLEAHPSIRHARFHGDWDFSKRFEIYYLALEVESDRGLVPVSASNYRSALYAMLGDSFEAPVEHLKVGVDAYDFCNVNGGTHGVDLGANGRPGLPVGPYTSVIELVESIDPLMNQIEELLGDQEVYPLIDENGREWGSIRRRDSSGAR